MKNEITNFNFFQFDGLGFCSGIDSIASATLRSAWNISENRPANSNELEILKSNNYKELYSIAYIQMYGELCNCN